MSALLFSVARVQNCQIVQLRSLCIYHLRKSAMSSRFSRGSREVCPVTRPAMTRHAKRRDHVSLSESDGKKAHAVSARTRQSASRGVRGTWNASADAADSMLPRSGAAYAALARAAQASRIRLFERHDLGCRRSHQHGDFSWHSFSTMPPKHPSHPLLWVRLYRRSYHSVYWKYSGYHALATSLTHAQVTRNLD